MRRWAPIGATPLLVSVLGCGAAQTPVDCRDPLASCPVTKEALTSGSELERYFPMVDGYTYQYRFESQTETGVETGVLSTTVQRAAAGGGVLVVGGQSKRIEFTPEGVVQTAPGPRAFLLKAPIAEGTTWSGPTGARVEIVRAKAQKAVPAGTFSDCVETKETRGGNPPQIIATTYCSGVGMVSLDTAAGAARVVASLTYYGPKIDLGGDGVRRVE